METNITNEPKFEETAISEYLDIVKKEYDIELQKKSSFESRAGIIIAFIGSIYVLLFDKINLTTTNFSITDPLTILSLLEFSSFCLIYFSLIASFFSSIKTITTMKLENFKVEDIDTVLLSESRSTSCTKVIFTYQSIIINYRKANSKKAKWYKISLISIFSLFLSLFIYTNI